MNEKKCPKCKRKLSHVEEKLISKGNILGTREWMECGRCGWKGEATWTVRKKRPLSVGEKKTKRKTAYACSKCGMTYFTIKKPTSCRCGKKFTKEEPLEWVMLK